MKNENEKVERLLEFQSKKHIKIKEPKLIRFHYSGVSNNKAISSLTDEYKKESQELQRKIKMLQDNEKQLKEEEDNWELKRDLTSFYRNPFCYMDYLSRKYFIDKANTLENLGIKKEMTGEFARLCRNIEDQISTFTKTEMKKIKNLEKECRKSNKAFPDYEQIPNNYILNEDEQNSILKDIQNNQKSSGKEKGYIETRPDAAELVINDKYSILHQEEIFKQALQCLSGDKMAPPKEKFLSVEHLNLEDIDTKKMVDSKNIKNLKAKADFYTTMSNLPNYNNGADIQKKNQNKYVNEREYFYNMLNQSEIYLNNIEKIQNQNGKLLSYLQEKLNQDFEKEAIKLGLTKLSICERSLEQINKDMQNVANHIQTVGLEDKKKFMDKNYEVMQEKIDNFLNNKNYLNKNINKEKITNTMIDKMYKQYSKGIKNKSNRTNSKIKKALSKQKAVWKKV